MNVNYYDVESLSNVFTLANFKEKENHLDIYVLSDTPDLTSDPNFVRIMEQRIYDKNKNFTGTIAYFDLHTREANEHLAKDFGLCTANPFRTDSKDLYEDRYKLVDDTANDYSEDKYPYLAGYNSYNYDTTMLAHYMSEAIVPFKGKILIQEPGAICTAAQMRIFNNMLFTKRFKDNMPSALTDASAAGGGENYNDPRRYIRLNMIKSGRHLDVARLNGKPEKIGLKRILGMLGYQILESDKLSQGQDVIRTMDELCDLIAYNVSDVVNLKELFYHPAYQGQFTLKKGLLKTYPDLIYRKKRDEYAPDIKPGNIKPDRLTIDSPSAQFATQCLCPYGHLTDLPAVSYMYPSKDKAKEEGIPRVNVLEEARKFFYELYPGDKHKAIRDKFDMVYKYYKSIEGMNFNDSDYYAEDYALERDAIERQIMDGEPVSEKEESMCHPAILKTIQKYPCCIPYYDKNGEPTSCFALFSTGGVHGAEYNMALYQYDMNEWRKQYNDIQYVKSIFTDNMAIEGLMYYDSSVKEDFVTITNDDMANVIWDAPSDNLPANVLKTGTICMDDKVVPIAIWNEKGGKIRYNYHNFRIPVSDAQAKIALVNKWAMRYKETDAGKTPVFLGSFKETVINKKGNPTTKTVKIILEPSKDTSAPNYASTTLNLSSAVAFKTLCSSEFIMPDGRAVKPTVFLKGSRSIANSEWKDIMQTMPQLFLEQKDGSTKLNPKYNYTSFSYANHEDFTSYYPNLLRMMEAFKNPGLGHDRYADIFENKQIYGKKMKDKSFSEEERTNFKVLREGTKLILNSASGAGDASFKSNIRVNNYIISMRIIGQLFSWRIGQAQSYAGAKIISTNTDGLYSVMEEEINNVILEKEAKNINVEIEPEPMYLISKDTNNRIELAKTGGVILSASGGTLTCHKGPNPSKSLAHPAIIDWALREYLIRAAAGYKGLSLFAPMDLKIAMNILKSAKNNKKEFPTDVKWLNMFQNILASSPSSHTYIYSYLPFMSLQHYNRVFIMKPGTPGCVFLKAAKARKVTPSMIVTRKKSGSAPTIWETKARQILTENGEDIDELLNTGRDIVSGAINNFDENWPIFISNKSLYEMEPAEIAFIQDNIDYDKYLQILKSTYEKNWMNKLPGIDYSAFETVNDDDENEDEETDD